jgi:DNA-binding PadR family transcriptional regulator
MTNDYLGEFEHLILLAIARCGGKAGGADVHAELEAVSRRGASLPAIYVTLARLEKKGFVRTSDLVEREEGGRPRRIFEITRAGARIMHHTRRTLERMWMDLPALGRRPR